MTHQHDLVPFVEALNTNQSLSPERRVEVLEMKLREVGVNRFQVTTSPSGQVSWVETITTIT